MRRFSAPGGSRAIQAAVRVALLLLATEFMTTACGKDPFTLYQTITVHVIGSGTGSGTVASGDPAVNINCSITAGTAGSPGCDDDFQDSGAGGVFNLLASPAAGSLFGSWTGCSTVSGTTCTLSFSPSAGDTTFNVTASFAPPLAACNNPVIIQDQFAADAGWTTTVTVGSGAPTQTVAFQASGGNPGGYRQMQHIFPGAGVISVYHDFGAVTYNPGTQGAIDHINYYEDQIELAPPFAGAAIGTGFTLTQGGGRYSTILHPPTGAFTNTSWATASLTGLTAASFSAGLNFATGGPITFGYFRSNTNNGGSAITLNHGIDNWKVEICR